MGTDEKGVVIVTLTCVWNDSSAVASSENAPMKGIKGLGERLAGLEQLHLEAKRLVQEQDDIAQSFVHNQQRASGLRDDSILPDLCASHKQQLVVMSQVSTTCHSQK